MQDLFPEFYRPDQATLDRIWDRGTFVLDTNVLLALYRLPDEGREDLFKTLNMIKDRIWVPYHVALEYQRNRLSVVAEQKNLIQSVTKHIDTTFEAFKTGLASHQLIQPEKVIERVSTALEDYKRELAELAALQADVHHEDKIRPRLDQLLAGRIGPAPDQEAIDTVNRKGDSRFVNSIPPGFGDASKKGTFLNAGVTYHSKFGDLYLWTQLLEQVKREKVDAVILLTSDNKDDWWARVRGKTLGPHTELVAECQAAGASYFHMYTLAQFLEIAGKRFGNTVRKEAIDQANDLDSDDRTIELGKGILEPLISMRFREDLSPEGLQSIARLMKVMFGLPCTRDGSRIVAYLPPSKTDLNVELVKQAAKSIPGVVDVEDLRAARAVVSWKRVKRIRIVPAEEAQLMLLDERVKALMKSWFGSTDGVSWYGEDVIIAPPLELNEAGLEAIRNAVIHLPEVNNAVIYETFE